MQDFKQRSDIIKLNFSKDPSATVLVIHCKRHRVGIGLRDKSGSRWPVRRSLLQQCREGMTVMWMGNDTEVVRRDQSLYIYFFKVEPTGFPVRLGEQKSQDDSRIFKLSH